MKTISTINPVCLDGADAPSAGPVGVAAVDSIELVGSFDGPALVDLDETLYLRNSTEDFLDGAHPRLLALVLLRALDVLQPWRLTGGVATRDVWRVRLVGLLFPWVWLVWRRRARALGPAFTNAALLEALLARKDGWFVVTDGFRPIVGPLCAAMGLDGVPIVASTLSPSDRLRGKLARAEEALGRETIASSLVLTDSESDRPLLDACSRPLLEKWPGAVYRRAFSDVYFPGEYVTRIKHPGERYIMRGILIDDFAFWLLASAGASVDPSTHLPALLLLLGSFWVIYERGYVENDRSAQLYESDPVLTGAFFEEEVATPALQPWIWALALGGAGLLLLRFPALPGLSDGSLWLAALLGTWCLYFIYNRVDKRSRTWLHFGLQVARVAAFAVVVPVTTVGAAALAAHVLGRWFPYAVYRAGREGWPRMPVALVRLLVFGLLVLAIVAATREPGALLTWSSLALGAWILFRARYELIAVWRDARWVAR